MKVTVLAALILAAAPAFAADGPARLVRDIRTADAGGSSNPYEFASLGESVFFGAGDGADGTGLWRTDGTRDGTRLVKSAGLSPTAFIEFDGALFFASNGEFWRSEGTAETTLPLRPTSAAGTVRILGDLVVAGDTLFFTASDAKHGAELWKSDGTAEGTRLVKDIVAGSGSPSVSPNGPLQLVALGDSVLFCANDRVHGNELWRSDGSAAGTVLLKDINPALNSYSCSDPHLMSIGDTVLFFANDGVHGVEPWRTDGTQAGTALVRDTIPGPAGGYPNEVAAGERWVLFNRGNELWRSDGTGEGTVRVKPIGAGELTFANGKAFFSARDAEHGYELWSTDGTEAGTLLVKDINPGRGDSGAQNLVAGDTFVYFAADDGIHGFELWKSDGTPEGTTLVRDVAPGPNSSNLWLSAALRGTLFFVASDSTHGYEPWVSDGTPTGTSLLRDIAKRNGSSPSELTASGGLLLFTADDGIHGTELWRSQGSDRGTELVTEIVPGNVSTNAIQGMTAARERFFFSLLGRFATSDGSAAGTFSLPDLRADRFAPFAAGVLFRGSDPVHGDEPWVSDGSVAGTMVLADIGPGGTGSAPQVAALDRLGLFVAVDAEYRNLLWSSDGTPAGTASIADLTPEPGFRGGARMIEAVDIVFVEVALGAVGSERKYFWRSDGSVAGTVLLDGDVFDAPVLTADGYATAGNTLFAVGCKLSLGTCDLWATDPTGARLVRVKESLGQTTPHRPGTLGGSAGAMFLGVYDPQRGLELWRSDGTAAGTVLVRDIAPGFEGSHPRSLIDVDGVALFTASDGTHGAELWRSDGTAAGTVQVQDIAPGPASSNPADLELVRDRVCFSAHDGIHGRELWCGWAAVLTGRPGQAIADLRDRVLELGLGSNAEAGLLARLDAAEQAIARDAAEVASGALGAFADQVSDKLRREIPIADADDLVELARQTADLLAKQERS